MGATSYGLRYPEATDSPDVARDLLNLAGDVNSRLYRAYPCTDTTRPTGLGAGDVGFLIAVADLGTLERWTGTAWAVVVDAAGAAPGSGSSGGGGGTATPSTVSAGWQSGSSGQSIAAGADVVVAFPTAIGGNDPQVTRATSGAGHEFTLTQTRLWTVSCTIRYTQNAVGGRIVNLVTDSGRRLARASAPPNTDAPWSVNLVFAGRLAAGTKVRVVTRHNSSTSPLPLEPDGGDSVSINFAGV